LTETSASSTETSASTDKLHRVAKRKYVERRQKGLPDFNLRPKKQKPEAGLWNRAFEYSYSLPAKDGSTERVLQKKFGWVLLPAYNFNEAQAHDLVSELLGIRLQQGRVTLQHLKSPNPNKVIKVHAVFFTGKGLQIIQQNASDVLRRPMKDTVGMSEISGRLVQTVTADADRSGDPCHWRHPSPLGLFPHV
jgi:hypothetical protein